MKTGRKIALLIGILLVAFGLTVLQIARHRGESFRVGLSFGGAAPAYDQKGYTVLSGGEERFSPGEAEALELSWLSGSVSVERYDGGEIVVREKAASALTDAECLRWKLSGGTLSLLPCANGVRTLPPKDLTVLVPRGITLGAVNAVSTSASVTLRGLEVGGAIDAASTSGALCAEDCLCAALRLSSTSGSQRLLRTEAGGTVRADTTSGGITAWELRCGELKLSSSSGAQRAEGLDCRGVSCESTSGSVELAFAAAPAEVETETTSGSVRLSFPKGTGLALDFDTASGDLHGDVIRGSLPVEVETTSGDLTIRYGA